MQKFKSVGLSDGEYAVLKAKKIAVIGCGNLGGYVLEILARLGIGAIWVVDDDVVGANSKEYKVNEAVLWIKQINPRVYVKGIAERLDAKNAADILEGMDMVMDCVDNVETKFILQSCCEDLDIPLIHGAADVWTGQVCTIVSGDKTLDKIYDRKADFIQHKKSSFIAAGIASYQAAECVKLLLNKGELLRGKVLRIDMLSNTCETEQVD